MFQPVRNLLPLSVCQLWLSLLVLLALPVSGSPREADTVPPFRASYAASLDKGLELNGNASRTLTRQDDGTWLYRTDVDSLVAKIDESLVLRWESGRVIPLRYRYRLSGLLIRNREESIDFDWQAGVATGSYRGKPFSLPLKDGTLDPLGYQLQLHQDIRTGQHKTRYQVIRRGKYDEQVFAVVGEESASGTQLLKAEKVREEGSGRQTYMWFDPARAFLLVRLLQIEPDGSRYELTLDRADLDY